MRNFGINIRSLVTALALVICVGCIITWISSDTFGQANSNLRAIGAKFQLSGNLHIRLNLPEYPRDPAAEKTMESVSRVVFQDEWVIINLTEDEEEATLVIPREKLIYLKSWEVDEEDQ